jgi:serine/threonine-protein kinase
MTTTDMLTPGLVLGRYELLLPIASGGMATVWAARQRGTRGFSKTVAIKTMLPNLSDDPQFEQMFLDEAALAARIEHPNVAKILDLGEQEDILYIVMEWVDGEAVSVLQKVAKKTETSIPMRVSLRIVHQACAALHAAHELRDENDAPLDLVHRDVSPQNILCTYDGVVKLIDFGVAKAVGRAGGHTSAGQIKGKLAYMSPEQARGAVVDRRTDIFALGIVLYKLTTGQHPFLGDSDATTLRNIISRPLLQPRAKNPEFPADIEQVIVKCLDKDPAKRFQTMAEMGVAVERLLAASASGEDDLGTFVRKTMGEHGAKRRAGIREAVRVADERFATGMQPVALSSAVTVNVADVSSTRTGSAVEEHAISDPATGGAHTSTSFATGTASAPSQAGPSPSAPQRESQSLTQQPVSYPPRAARGVRVAPLVAVVSVAAVIVGVAGVQMSRASSTASAPAAAAAPASTDESHVATTPPQAPPVVATSTATVASASPAPASATASAPPSTTPASVAVSRVRAAPKAPPAARPAAPAPEKASASLSDKGQTIYTTPGF